MDPIASMAQKKAEERRKADKLKARQGALLSPGVIKGAFVAALVALFVAGVLIQFERNKASERNDPAAAMRREMGMMDLEGNTFEPQPAFQRHLDDLSSTNQELRLQAIDGLLAEYAPGAYAVIKGLLRDKDPVVRARAAELLGQHKVPGCGASLVPLLTDATPEVRRAAAEGLKNFAGEQGVLYLLVEPIRSADPEVALLTIDVWKAFSRSDEAAAARVIVEAFGSPDVTVAVSAIQACLSGLTTEHLKAIREELRAIEESRAGTPVADEAASAGAFIDQQEL